MMVKYGAGFPCIMPIWSSRCSVNVASKWLCRVMLVGAGVP